MKSLVIRILTLSLFVTSIFSFVAYRVGYFSMEVNRLLSDPNGDSLVETIPWYMTEKLVIDSADASHRELLTYLLQDTLRADSIWIAKLDSLIERERFLMASSKTFYGLSEKVVYYKKLKETEEWPVPRQNILDSIVKARTSFNRTRHD